MNEEGLAYTSAVELVRRELSPVEVMEATLARLEALNPRLNAGGSSTGPCSRFGWKLGPPLTPYPVRGAHPPEGAAASGRRKGTRRSTGSAPSESHVIRRKTFA